MRTPSRSFARLGSTLALLAVLSPTLSHAADAPGAAADSPSDEAVIEQRRAEAKQKYQQGAEAYAAGHYKDAVDYFLAADRIAPSAPLSFNIARAYEKLGDGSGALRWYRDYLRRNPSAANADTVRAGIAALAAALAKKGVQQLTVLSSPDGATVAVDDQPVGVAPWTGELAPGKHHLLLTRRGYVDAERDIELQAGEPLDVTVRLEQQSAEAAPSAAPAAGLPTANAPPPAPDDRPHGPRLGIVPYLALGAGAAALGGALTFELLRRSAESDAKKEPTQLGYQSRLETEQSRQSTARVFLGVGGVLAVAGGVMLLVDTPRKGPKTSAGFVCAPALCGLSARGQF